MSKADRWLLPDGIEELLPEQARAAESLRRQLLDLYESWGYELVIPPLVEYTESLLVGLGGDIDLQTFRVTDQLTGRLMGVRADITPQAARIDAHSLQREGVVRLCYAGSVLHTRAKGPLASRSPIQLGAECYGDASLESDLEVVSLMLETLQCAGQKQLTLDLGHVAVYREVMAQCQLPAELEQRFFDLLQRKASTELQSFFAEASLSEQQRSWMQALPRLHGDASVLAEARQVFADLPAVLQAIDDVEAVARRVSARVSDLNCYFDLAELRGYHYHTGLVFSALAPGMGQPLASGGRYDDIGAVFGRARPATGFSVDLKALMSRAPEPEQRSAIAAPCSEDAALWDRIAELRASGEIVLVVLPGQSVPAQCDRELSFEQGQWAINRL